MLGPNGQEGSKGEKGNTADVGDRGPSGRSGVLGFPVRHLFPFSNIVTRYIVAYLHSLAVILEEQSK